MFFFFHISCKIILLSIVVSQLLHQLRNSPSVCPADILPRCLAISPVIIVLFSISASLLSFGVSVQHGVLVLMIWNAFNSGLYSFVFSFRINDLVLASPSNLLHWDSQLDKMLLKKPGQFSALRNREKDGNCSIPCSFRPRRLRCFHGACAWGCGRMRGRGVLTVTARNGLAGRQRKGLEGSEVV